MPVLTEEVLRLKIPEMVRVRQQFESHALKDVEDVVGQELQKEALRRIIQAKPGQRIALAVGSRGINNLSRIVRATVRTLTRLGARPFIVPAMGSHGGGTPEGQEDILLGYGISKEAMGAPIVSSMDVVRIGDTGRGIPIFFDKTAYEADMVVPIARVKPHTDFKGRIESGICKMMAIGLGNHIGCSRLHQEGFDCFHTLIPEVGELLLEKGNIGFGLAVVEDAYDQTAIIEAVPAQDIMTREPQLLVEAKRLMPRIMVPKIDVLIVEEIGKEISGAGMDPNIVGRTTKGRLSEFNGPDIQRIVVLDLSEETHGNACGIGLADFTTKNVLSKIDYAVTYANTIASGNPEAGRIPIALDTDHEAICAAISCCSRIDVHSPLIVRIKNTLRLETIHISNNMIPLVKENDAIWIEHDSDDP